jgi:hypothetical protein
VSDLVDNNLYKDVKDLLEQASAKAYAAVNFAMVEAYWNVGRLIVERQGGEERAEYGSELLRFMRQFYMTFPIRNALRSELSWTHYRFIMKVENENARLLSSQGIEAKNKENQK